MKKCCNELSLEKLEEKWKKRRQTVLINEHSLLFSSQEKQKTRAERSEARKQEKNGEMENVRSPAVSPTQPEMELVVVVVGGRGQGLSRLSSGRRVGEIDYISGR